MARSGGTWAKGQSGNPAGAPKRGDSVAAAIREFMAGSDGKKRRAEVLAESLYRKATQEQDVAAARLLLSYTDGLPTQRIETADTTPQTDEARFHDWLTKHPDVMESYVADLEAVEAGGNGHK